MMVDRLGVVVTIGAATIQYVDLGGSGDGYAPPSSSNGDFDTKAVDLNADDRH